jgi:hypothetical protein
MPTHSDIKELHDRFASHRDELEERLKQTPSDDAARDMLEDAEEAIEVLEPLLTAEDDDLDKYDSEIDELIEEEQALALKLKS